MGFLGVVEIGYRLLGWVPHGPPVAQLGVGLDRGYHSLGTPANFVEHVLAPLRPGKQIILTRNVAVLRNLRMDLFAGLGYSFFGICTFIASALLTLQLDPIIMKNLVYQLNVKFFHLI